MPNRLINETSPYLLQHAHNPVDWYPWGDEALQKAKEEDKPILISIGYSACHWCHVMEKESFEDEATAAIMNEHFINIKIDREERPDLDHIYMDAVQAMTGSGGWPLNVFLTPGKEPFYGGTYFPPQAIINRPSWRELLSAVSTAFLQNRADIEQQANRLTDHLLQTGSFGISENSNEPLPDLEQSDVACGNLLNLADKQWGGFGQAPKFPQTFSIQFLLRYYFTERNRNESHAEAALKQALVSLDIMIDGGIHDQLGGGFSRYATDPQWLVPHFEKMLYDNALLASVLSEAFQLTGKGKYKTALEHTLAFVEREFMQADCGFYAALDADSEGVEGKFYVWEYDEVNELLGNDAKLFCDYYNITQNGNWEGKNILRVLKPLPAFALERKLTIEGLEKILTSCREKLMAAREKRIRPGLDDKIILGWNALMNCAFCKAYAATGHQRYKELAVGNIEFLLKVFAGEHGSLQHVWEKGTAKFPAFLDDYANIIQALLQMHRITGHTDWLLRAKQFAKKVILDFSDQDVYFYYTPHGQPDVIIRKKEVYDGATPSGNAAMAQNLYELGLLLDEQEWVTRANKMINGVAVMATKYPTSFGSWLVTMFHMIKGTREIVLIGDYQKDLKSLLYHYLPHTVLMASETTNNEYPLLAGKTLQEKITFYLCENYSCKQPVFSLQELVNQIEIEK